MRRSARKPLLVVIAAIVLVLVLFYLYKSGVITSVLGFSNGFSSVSDEVAAVAASGSSASSSVSTGSAESSPITVGSGSVSINADSVTHAAKVFITGITSIAMRFVEMVSEMIRGKTVTETVINGAVLTLIFVGLGYFSVLIARFIRFLFFVAAAFTAGLTMMYVLGLW